MSPEEIERQIGKICWGGKFAFVEDENGNTHTIVIKSLGLKDKNFIDFIYNDALERAKAANILTRFELRDELKRKNLWSDEDEDSIKQAREKIQELEEQKKEHKKGSKQFRISKRLIGAYTNSLADLLYRRKSLFSVAAEEHASEAKNSAVVYCSTYDEHEDKFWKDYNEFQKEIDYTLISNIIGEINKITSINVTSMRKIARSPAWRFRWSAGKDQGNLFGKNLLDLDIEQQNLVYWSQVYDSVYEAYERPSDEVIEDDKKLDEWFENEKRKKKVKELSEQGGKVRGVNVSSNVGRHGEIFIVTNPAINPNAPSNQEVENLNTSFVRKFKAKEQELIKSKGLVNEKELRSRNNRIARKVIGSSEAVIGGGDIGGRARGGKASKKIYPGGTVGNSGKMFKGKGF